MTKLKRIWPGLYITPDEQARVQYQAGRGWVVQVPNPRTPGWRDTSAVYNTLRIAEAALQTAPAGPPPVSRSLP